jgi:ABC-type multidrug transport system fused ATPase/permease subunit
LSGVTFEIQKNQTVALVGESGSGKSTIADLLVGLYEPTEGTVEIGGREFSEISLYQWRENIGVVDQEYYLLNSSIRENIAFARPDASFEQIQTAAKIAAADDFIRKTPNQYDTVIGDRGLKLSGGQRQRLVLARALLRNPSLIVLDEATSALDSESEKLIQRSIEAMQGDKTILIIAHRLSTIAKVDWIVVLDEGVVAEQGTRNELLAANGLFAHYLKMQNTDEPYN